MASQWGQHDIIVRSHDKLPLPHIPSHPRRSSVVHSRDRVNHATHKEEEEEEEEEEVAAILSASTFPTETVVQFKGLLLLFQ